MASNNIASSFAFFLSQLDLFLEVKNFLLQASEFVFLPLFRSIVGLKLALRSPHLGLIVQVVALVFLDSVDIAETWIARPRP